MKKTAVLLAVVLLVSMLGGCYKSDTEVKFAYNGEVEVTSALLVSSEANDIFASQNSGIGYIEDLDKFLASFEDSQGEAKLEYVTIDENGNVLAEENPQSPDSTVLGRRLKMKYASLAALENSMVLTQYLPTTALIQQESAVDGQKSGLKIVETRTLFGTKYSVSGSFNVFGHESEAQLQSEYEALKVERAQYEEMIAAIPDEETRQAYYDMLLPNMQQMDNLLSAYENVKGLENNSFARITFRFPLAFSKSNADQKNFLGNTLTWTATKDAPQRDVYFEVTVINPLVLGMALVILLLLIVILVLVLKKKKDTPDAFFVDADGNEIPVFDVEDAEADEEEAVFDEEGIEEMAELEEAVELEEVEETEEKDE